MKYAFRTIILAGLLLPGIALGRPTPTAVAACLELLGNKAFTIPRPQATQLSWLRGGLRQIPSQAEPNHTVSLQKAPSSEKRAGIFFRVIRRPGRPWLSAAGDPRFPIVALGRETAAVLGFYMENDHTVIYPTPDRINWGLSLLNHQLPIPLRIPVRFYEQIIDTSTDYLERLGERMEIPIQNGNPEMSLHDYIFHVTPILETPLFLGRVQFAAQNLAPFLIRFAQFVAPDQVQQLRLSLERSFDALIAQPTVHLVLMAPVKHGEQTVALRESMLVFRGHGPIARFVRAIGPTDVTNRFADEQSQFLAEFDHHFSQIPGPPTAQSHLGIARENLERRSDLQRAARAVLQMVAR